MPPSPKHSKPSPGFTGLGYVVNDKGVYIWNQSNSPASSPRDSAIGILQLDNGMQILVPKSQVPEDMPGIFENAHPA